MKNEPLRMCIACRNMKPKFTMLKIVKNKDGNIQIDNHYKMQGRGAYICENEQCLILLEKKKLLNKVFKCNIDEKIYTEIRRSLNEW